MSPPSWSPVDLHAHSTFSDGALSVAEVVATAAERGVRPSVADHLSGCVSQAVRSMAGVRAYLDELERHAVLRGGEFCWHDTLWRELPDDVVRRFTHRVGSLHGFTLPGGHPLHMFDSRWPDGLTPAAYMDAHVGALEALAREMPVDVFAHPTLLPIPLRRRPPEELWTEAHEARAVEALHAAGIAFEVSNRYRPHERFVARAADRGVRISLGSDGHTREQIADVAWPLGLTRSLGVPDAELYDPAAHGSKTRAA